MDERVHLLGILAADPEFAEQFVVGGDVKALDLTCNLGGEPIQVGIRNVGQRTDARTTVGDAFPAAGQIIAQRRDDTGRLRRRDASLLILLTRRFNRVTRFASV